MTGPKQLRSHNNKSNRARIARRDFLDLHPAGSRRHKNILRRSAVEHDAEVELAVDRQRLFDEQTAHFLAFGPSLVRDQLHAGTRSFGIISAMIGVGLIVGTQMVNAVAKGFSKKHVALSGLVGLSFATLVLALFQTAWLAGLSMFGIGFAIAFIIVPAQTLMQQETPHDMLGRVSSSFMAVFSLSQLLGLLLSGALANSIGVRHLFMSSAVLLIVLSAMGYLWLREDKPREQKAVAASG